MFLTVHSLVALTSIKYISNPFLLFIVNFLGHYILDIIPHGEGDNIKKLKGGNKEIFILACLDFAFIGLTSLLFYQTFNYNKYLIIIALLGATLPDISWGLYSITKLKILKWSYDLYLWTHKLIKYRTNSIFEYAIQIIPIIICYFLLK
ncbi:hypothetical protein K8R66_03770 [bacterium]|nr:hypothetical protein [bacterium]